VVYVLTHAHTAIRGDKSFIDCWALYSVPEQLTDQTTVISVCPTAHVDARRTNPP